MIVDWTITVGNIIEISAIAGGGIYTLLALNNSVTNMRAEIGSLKIDFTDMKEEIKKVGEVLIKMAAQEQRQSATEKRLANVEQDIRELRHGHGFVQRDINGEYPR